MRTGDSRALDGPGVIPGQDHRPEIDVDLRAVGICSRIVDRDQDGTDREDETLRGDRQGLSPWPQEGDRRPMAAWREVRAAVVVGFDGYTGSGAGDGADEPGAAYTGGSFGGGGANLVSTGVPAESGPTSYAGVGQSFLPPTWWSGQPVNGQANPLAIKQSSVYNGYSV